MSRVYKKIGTPFEICEPSAAILMVNLTDPQYATVKVFLKAIKDAALRFFVVGNKADLVSKGEIKRVREEFRKRMMDLGGVYKIPFIVSMQPESPYYRNLQRLKDSIELKFDEDARIVVLGIFNSGKTSLIRYLTGNTISKDPTLEVGDIPGTTMEFYEHKYREGVLIDSVGQIIDVSKPLMVSIDFDGCETIYDKINRVFTEEAKGVIQTQSSARAAIKKAVEVLKKRITVGSNIFVVGAGASALVAKEMEGQGFECGLPVYAFTNIMADMQSVSFAKGLGETEGGISRHLDRLIRAQDIVIGVSASGGTGFVYDALKRAQGKGAYTIAITENPDTPLGKYAELVIKSDAKPEGPSSSKIQTAHLVIGHALILLLADILGVTAEQSVGYMLPEHRITKKMGIK